MDAADARRQLQTENVGLKPFVVARNSTSFFYLATKRLLDIIGALIGIALLSPLLLALMVAVKATSKGPAIYSQTRVGKDGRKFQIYKFRTMVENADHYERFLTSDQIAYYRSNRKLEDDPRLTRLGKKLRRTSADELPQLVNVMLGDMSFIGPRPMLEEEIEQYGSTFALYTQLRPGITGLWQVTKRHSTQMSSRAEADYKYFQCNGWKMDFMILIRTIAVVLCMDGAC